MFRGHFSPNKVVPSKQVFFHCKWRGRSLTSNPVKFLATEENLFSVTLGIVFSFLYRFPMRRKTAFSAGSSHAWMAASWEALSCGRCWCPGCSGRPGGWRTPLSLDERLGLVYPECPGIPDASLPGGALICFEAEMSVHPDWTLGA